MKSLNLTIKQMNVLQNKIPNIKKVAIKEPYIYSRTYKNILFYEISFQGIPFARYFYVKNRWLTLSSVKSYMFGWHPLGEKFKVTNSHRYTPYGFSYYNIFRVLDFKESKTIKSKNDLRNYIDVRIKDILLARNIKLFETAYKEGWGEIYSNHRFNELGKTIQEKWGLKTFSRSEIHKLKDWLNPEDYSEYLDYVNTAYKARGKHLKPSQYFIKTWKQAHKRDIRLINKEAEKQRKLAKLRKDRLKRKLYQIKNEDIIKLKDPKTQDELKVLGKDLRNCVGGYNPKSIKIFFIKSLNEKIAVEYTNGKIQQAKVIDNMEVPKKIKQMLMEQLTRKEKYDKI